LDKEARAKYHREWYRKNATVHKARTRKNRKQRHREWMLYKSMLSCQVCGFQHPAVIDFHHIEKDKDNKMVNVLVKNGQYSLALAEVKEKCIPLCCNCHRILHWEQRK
tara:strand:- start:23 stop:346 length:324 start_codon:yes stop_codon:yes gene_type:complete